jgi:cyanate lyase
VGWLTHIAADFRTSLERKKDPKGDRVVITLDGKVSEVWPQDRRSIHY